MPKIIIPVKGNEPMTAHCIASVQKYVENPDFLIVDNLGTFGISGIPVIRGNDWGFAESCNRAANTTNDDLLFLNNDIEAISDFLPPMLKLLGKPVGVVGALLFYPDGRIQHAGSSYNNGNPNHPERRKAIEEVGPLHTREVEGVTFACALVSRECWDDLGGLDAEMYPFGYEDIDFCLRAKKAGWRVYFTPEARLIHREHVTQGRYLSEIRKKSDISIKNLRERWS